ncbi:SHOCT domain-containing protein [Ketobacter sp. MCCC 1A13808]|uniref:SHOCT domain-containing protein n=1 Tax=Ketobacter sp. MCCC 1A13808 TaxID=2602738 RepID=UPI0012EC1D6F|nr:SHOCT domain-containing protein [Ketobacter sp. MCCC 1A13808]MVF11975.1 SHOCT domain-containing protein [Ketobacter sp. MCCC 1A13808]
MQQLTQTGQNIVNNISSRYNLSSDAVVHMLIAVQNGAGSMAQFNCPELGGSGQWMRGGMTMVGDMFNHGLKMTVDNLCNELSNALANNQIFPPPPPAGSPGSNHWWPADLGQPFSSGAQNNTRYAVFPGRLAIEMNGAITVYDTLDNNISGVSQQQGGDNSLTFSSQYGTIAVSSLPLISGPGLAPAPNTNFAEPPPPVAEVPAAQSQPQTTYNAPGVDAEMSNVGTNSNTNNSPDAIIGLIERLAKMRDAGAITDDEFNAKKVELLSRI